MSLMYVLLSTAAFKSWTGLPALDIAIKQADGEGGEDAGSQSSYIAHLPCEKTSNAL